jgi:hypothetical protein
MVIRIYEVIIAYPDGHFAYKSNGSPVQYICATDPKNAQAMALGNAGLSVTKDGVLCYVREFPAVWEMKEEGS